MSSGRPDGSERRPEDVVLRGAGAPALALGAITTAVAAVWGSPAAIGAAVGAALTLATMALSPLILRTSSRWSPPAVMVVAVSVYGMSVVLLGVAFLLLRDATWLSQAGVGAGIFATATGWMAGHVRAAGRLRVLAYGSPPEASGSHDVAGHDGSGQSPGRSSH